MNLPLMNLTELALSLQRSLAPQGLGSATEGVESERMVLLQCALFLLILCLPAQTFQALDSLGRTCFKALTSG